MTEDFDADLVQPKPTTSEAVTALRARSAAPSKARRTPPEEITRLHDTVATMVATTPDAKLFEETLKTLQVAYNALQKDQAMLRAQVRDLKDAIDARDKALLQVVAEKKAVDSCAEWLTAMHPAARAALVEKIAPGTRSVRVFALYLVTIYGFTLDDMRSVAQLLAKHDPALAKKLDVSPFKRPSFPGLGDVPNLSSTQADFSKLTAAFSAKSKEVAHSIATSIREKKTDLPASPRNVPPPARAKAEKKMMPVAIEAPSAAKKADTPPKEVIPPVADQGTLKAVTSVNPGDVLVATVPLNEEALNSKYTDLILKAIAETNSISVEEVGKSIKKGEFASKTLNIIRTSTDPAK